MRVEVSDLIKELYKKDSPTEIIGNIIQKVLLEIKLNQQTQYVFV